MFGAGQHKIMIVAGPNRREDFHIEEGEELFYMIKGHMQLDVMEKDRKREIVIKEGEFFLLPPRVPHSPQRFPDTIGLVVERERLPAEMDGLRWYVRESPRHPPPVLYQDWFHCVDLGTQLKPIIESFFASDAHEKNEPAREYTKADEPFDIDTESSVGDPINFREWAAANADGKTALMYGGADGHEYQVEVCGGPDTWTHWKSHEGEVFFWQFDGEISLTVKLPDGTEKDELVGAGNVYMLPAGGSYKARRTAGTLGIVITNKVTLDTAGKAAGAGHK